MVAHNTQYLNQPKVTIIWCDKNGKNHDIKKMSDKHIKNCLALIIKNVWRMDYRNIFERELRDRRKRKLKRVLKHHI
jgi:hypothetical protein